MKPLVSVVIPTYNRSNNILLAIKSVLNQTFQNFEIIVCDDGSTDDTMSKVSGLNSRNVQIHYKKIEHSGLPSMARNLGIERAQGDWVAFLDSDDTWERNKLEVELESARETNSDMVCSNATTNEGSEYFESSRSRSLFFENLVKENSVVTSSVLVKKKILLEVGLFNENKVLKAVEDYELWLKIATTHKIFYTNECLVTYSTNSLDSIRRAYTDLILIKKAVYTALLRDSQLYKLKIPTKIISKLQSFVEKPTISVIMPTKDTNSIFLLESVKSILNQTFSDFEFIIIDDGSRIPVSKVLSKISDLRIKIFRNVISRGISYSLNLGIAKSQGSYIARMDADDIAQDMRLKVQKDYLDNHTDIYILGSWTEVFGDQNYVRKTMTKPEDVSLEMLFRCPIAHPSVMMKSSFIKEQSTIYAKSYDNAEDYELWARFIKLNTIANIGEVLLKYRIHSSQVGKKNEEIQNMTSDKIRRDLVHKLIVDISDKEIDIHNKIANYEIRNSDNPIEIARCLTKVVIAGSLAARTSKSSAIKRIILESYPILTRLNYFKKIVYSGLIIYYIIKQSII